jgi:hypothetical protein
MKDEEVTEEFRARVLDAVEDSAARERNWTVFHNRLNAAVSGRLAELRRRTSGGYRATAAAGAAWWDYAAGAALAAVPLGLAAALLLVTYLRSDAAAANDAPPVVARVAIAAAGADSARAAFESVLTGVESPRAAMATLIPVPAAAFIAESAGRTAR